MSQFPFAGQPGAFQQAPQFAAPPFPQAPQAPAPYPQAAQFPATPQFPQVPQFPQAPAYPAQPAPYGQQYGQPFYPQPAPVPQQQFAPGNLGAFFGQPRTGRPQGVSWKGMPDGYTVAGVVAEDVTDRDVVLETDPTTKAVRTFRDGSPKYQLAVTLRVQPSQAYPEGLATLYCKGDLWDKMNAAMEAAGRQGAPKAGDVIYVSLMERRPGRGSVPRNIFAVQYQTNGAEAPAPVPQASVQPQLPQAPQAPAPQLQQAPQAPAPPGMPNPAGLAAQLSPEQQALLAALKGNG